MRTYYINRRGSGYRETVAEYPAGKREAVEDCAEYQLSDPSGYYYVSTRMCANWRTES